MQLFFASPCQRMIQRINRAAGRGNMGELERKDRAMSLLSRWFRRAPAAPSWIAPAELARRLEGDAAPLILDVRGPDEFAGPLGHIPEAINLPLNELPAQLGPLADENRPVVVVCKTDRRSSLAAQQLQEAGLSNVSVLRGGMEQWRELGLPAG
jgi:rhodanese-related sulfurtransferase